MTDDEFFDRFTRAGRAYIEAASVVVVIFGVIVLAITLVVLVVVDPGEVDMMFMIAKLEIDGGEIKLSVVDSENTLEGARQRAQNMDNIEGNAYVVMRVYGFPMDQKDIKEMEAEKKRAEQEALEDQDPRLN